MIFWYTSGNIMKFLQDIYPILLTLHLLTMAIGLGGATVSDILFFKFLKDFRISNKEGEVLDVLKDVILTAMFFIALTGILLFVANPALIESPAFLVKGIAAAVLIINGICLHSFIAPYLIKLDFKAHSSMQRSWYRLAFALGAISVCTWYSVLLIAGLKSILPQSFGLLFSVYLCALVIAISVSQFAEGLLRKRAHR